MAVLIAWVVFEWPGQGQRASQLGSVIGCSQVDQPLVGAQTPDILVYLGCLCVNLKVTILKASETVQSQEAQT